MTDAILSAYLAGAIDSDGTIGIRRSTYAMRVRRDSTVPVYSERIALRQVTPDIPTLLKQEFGGSLGVTKSSSARGRDLYSWAATDLRAVACLTALLPYLRVKRAQADNCLALRLVKERSRLLRVAPRRGHMGSAPRPADIGEEMETLYVTAKALNRVGV